MVWCYVALEVARRAYERRTDKQIAKELPKIIMSSISRSASEAVADQIQLMKSISIVWIASLIWSMQSNDQKDR